MHFKNRIDAGRQLAQALLRYKDEEAIVFALPRGGVILGAEVAKALHAPLSLIIARKIGHPRMPEYAIAAIAEDGHYIGNAREIKNVDPQWWEEEKNRQSLEAKRRRELYLAKSPPCAKDKVAILVDDGIATGLTMHVAILELGHQEPKKIVVAVPVAPHSTLKLLASKVDEVVTLLAPAEGEFLGAIGAYYEAFPQVSDEEVTAIMRRFS